MLKPPRLEPYNATFQDKLNQLNCINVPLNGTLIQDFGSGLPFYGKKWYSYYLEWSIYF